MAITKVARTLLVSQSLAAGASVDATELNLSSALGADIYVKITNLGTAPTTVPFVQFYQGEATGIKRKKAPGYGDLVASSVSDPMCSYGPRCMFANVKITAGATQGCTVEVYAQELTNL